MFRALLLSGSCLLAAAAAAQQDFVTELHLAVDPAPLRGKKPDPRRVSAIEDVLKKRLVILGEQGTSVKVNSPEDIVIRAPLTRVAEVQQRMLGRIGRLEIRHLEEVQTNFNPDGRYLVEIVTVEDRSPTPTEPLIRFVDRRARVPVPAAEMIKRCPLLLTESDLEPGSARRVGDALAVVRVKLTERASDRLQRFGLRPGRLLAVVLDGELLAIHSANPGDQPRRSSRDRRKSTSEDEPDPRADLAITGGFRGPYEAGYLAAVLNSGPLPYKLVVLSSRVVAQ